MNIKYGVSGIFSFSLRAREETERLPFQTACRVVYFIGVQVHTLFVMTSPCNIDCKNYLFEKFSNGLKKSRVHLHRYHNLQKFVLEIENSL